MLGLVDVSFHQGAQFFFLSFDLLCIFNVNNLPKRNKKKKHQAKDGFDL